MEKNREDKRMNITAPNNDEKEEMPEDALDKAAGGLGMYMNTCMRCGVKFHPTNPREMLCPACRRRRR